MKPLQSVRIHLSGAIPDDATEAESAAIRDFVQQFSKEVFRQGGTLVHGSHPTLIDALRAAAQPFVQAGGSRDSMTLVRSRLFSETVEASAAIESQREWSVIEMIPSDPLDREKSLVSMRQWMAERCDVVVALGGNRYEVNPDAAGVPHELEAMLQRGCPGFVLGGFGGAARGYIRDCPEILTRLQNGWTAERNLEVASSTEVAKLVAEILAQIKLLPRFRGNLKSGKLFRILALDGGGIRGAFTAAVLARWAEMLGSNGPHELVKHFDLVAGTSTGAILAIGLGMGLTPAEMLEFYKAKGPSIFPKDRGVRHWVMSKHDSGTLEQALTAVFQAKRLSFDSICRLVIPTVRAVRGHADVIVTAHSEVRTAFSDITAVQAALASAAAPTYFEEATVTGSITSQSYLDGGVWANNPVLPAIVEAVCHLAIPIDRIDVLSVGTLGNEMDFSTALGKGKLGWATRSSDLFFAAQESAASTLSDGLLSRARHLRVNQLTPIEIKLDNADALAEMTLRGAEVGQDTFSDVKSRFLDGIFASDWRDPTLVARLAVPEPTA